MKYKIEIWPIQKLISIIKKGQIDLSPEYQRNPIWTLRAQRSLIDTIMLNQPIPNFFILTKSKNKYEMVDGQQRARTIYDFLECQFKDTKGQSYDDLYAPINDKKNMDNNFCNYELSITLINEISKKESIEEFYALVNSSGLRLNRPELDKAKYYNTEFLKLIRSLAESSDFNNLNLFTAASVNRMNNIDLVGELVAFMKYGFSDKKDKVNALFERDISKKEYESLASGFKAVLNHLNRFNTIMPLRGTRFKQRNDFYSLFAFIYNNSELKEKSLDYYYSVLLRLDVHIRPSQEDCDPLRDYAINCVTQSNSKEARKNRDSFLTKLFLNSESKPNDDQKKIMKYFGMKNSDVKKVSSLLTLEIRAMKEPEQD